MTTNRGAGGISSASSELYKTNAVTMIFSAQRANPIYGNSLTVQPAAFVTQYLIKY